MPCDSSYMEPTTKERKLKETTALLVYTLEALGHKLPQDIIDQNNDYYGHGVDRVPELCALLKNMSEMELERIVYDGRSKNARDLANWWEEHQAADAQRVTDTTEAYRRALIAVNNTKMLVATAERKLDEAKANLKKQKELMKTYK